MLMPSVRTVQRAGVPSPPALGFLTPLTATPADKDNHGIQVIVSMDRRGRLSIDSSEQSPVRIRAALREAMAYLSERR
jgi:hypothetical protein